MYSTQSHNYVKVFLSGIQEHSCYNEIRAKRAKKEIETVVSEHVIINASKASSKN